MIESRSASNLAMTFRLFILLASLLVTVTAQSEDTERIDTFRSAVEEKILNRFDDELGSILKAQGLADIEIEQVKISFSQDVSVCYADAVAEFRDSKSISMAEILPNPEQGTLNWIVVDIEEYFQSMIPCMSLAYENAGIPDDLLGDK